MSVDVHDTLQDSWRQMRRLGKVTPCQRPPGPDPSGWLAIHDHLATPDAIRSRTPPDLSPSHASACRRRAKLHACTLGGDCQALWRFSKAPSGSRVGEGRVVSPTRPLHDRSTRQARPSRACMPHGQSLKFIASHNMRHGLGSGANKAHPERGERRGSERAGSRALYPTPRPGAGTNSGGASPPLEQIGRKLPDRSNQQFYSAAI